MYIRQLEMSILSGQVYDRLSFSILFLYLSGTCKSFRSILLSVEPFSITEQVSMILLSFTDERLAIKPCL